MSATTLNARQRAFVRAYTSGKTFGNGTRSAEKAGYQGSDETLAVTAHELLKHPKIAEAVALRERNAEDASIADRYEREQLLTAILRGEVTEPKVVSDGEGGTMIEQAAPALRDRLKALELHGKMGGDYVERHEHSGPEGRPIAIEAVPPAVARAKLIEIAVGELGPDAGERLVRRWLGEPEPVVIVDAEES